MVFFSELCKAAPPQKKLKKHNKLNAKRKEQPLIKETIQLTNQRNKHTITKKKEHHFWKKREHSGSWREKPFFSGLRKKSTTIKKKTLIEKRKRILERKVFFFLAKTKRPLKKGTSEKKKTPDFYFLEKGERAEGKERPRRVRGGAPPSRSP